MADLSGINFDPSQTEDLGEVGSVDIVPPGVHTVAIVDSNIGPNKSNTGQVLQLDYQVLEGQSTGVVLKEWLNVVHNNQKTQAIGRSNLKQICDAVGMPQGLLTDSSMLHGKPLSIKVEVKPGTKINPNTKQPYPENNIRKRMPRQAMSAESMPPQYSGTPQSGLASGPPPPNGGQPQYNW